MELQWPLILFTTLVAWSAGLFGAQAVAVLRGGGGRAQMPALVASVALLAAGGIAVFFHLQHWERIFNGFGHITSGITLEFVGCIVFAVVLVLYFLMMRRSEDGMAPKWCGILAIVVGAALPIVTGMSYLMPSLPVWNTPLLPVYYLCNTVLMGGLSALVIAGATGADDVKGLAIKLVVAGGIAQLVVVAAYAVAISSMGGLYSDVTYYFDPTLPDVGMVDTDAVVGSLFTGSQALAFWLGAVILGSVAPVVLGIVARTVSDVKKLAAYAAAGLVCAVIGGLCWRSILYVVAVSVFALY